MPRFGMHERSTAVLTHILGIFTLFVGPLIVYFAFRKKAGTWLRDHLDESVNYNILVVAVFIVLIVLAVVLTYVVSLPMIALLLLMLGLLILPVKVVLEIVAAVKASKGKPFHFPLDIKMIK